MVSVTLRALPADAVLAVMEDCKLECVEWGGDVHAPHGDLKTASELGRKTRDAGIDVLAYGSYYRLDESESAGLPFQKVLDTAAALGAHSIRVWAGRRSKAECDQSHLQKAADDAIRIAELAAGIGITVCLEYHANTLTDSIESTQVLLQRASHPSLQCLWQPPIGKSACYCLASLRAIGPRLAHLHVFHWWPDANHRLPLIEGQERWMQYLRFVIGTNRKSSFLLEFVPGDDPGLVAREVNTLRSWLPRDGEKPLPAPLAE